MGSFCTFTMQTRVLLDIFWKFNLRNKTALTFRTGVRTFHYSYHDLHVLSLKMAQWLQNKGVEKGDRVMIWAPNSPWWVVTFWGCLLRGAIVVPVDFSSNRERAISISDLTEAKILVQSKYKLDCLRGRNTVFAEDLEQELSDVQPISIDSVPETYPDDVVELIYTSGTTGNPKGVMLTNKNICCNLVQIGDLTDVNHEYNFLSLLPLSHMFEQTGGFFTPLLHGSRIVYILTLKPSTVIEAFKEENIYVAMAVPALLKSLKSRIENELEKKHLMPVFNLITNFTSGLSNESKKRLLWPVTRKFGKNMKFFISGGSALDVETAIFWGKLGFPVIEGYGLTECSPVLTANNQNVQVLGSTGKAVRGVELKIVKGEILARGPNIFPGYWNNQAATDAAFDDGWFKTGDMGEIDSNGRLFIKGRSKDMILGANGMNVYPDDIEAVLNNMPGIKESCVLGIKSSGGEEVHAVLALSGTVEPKELVKLANGKLEDHQRIRGFTVWPDPEFPKTSTQKIQKFKVKEKIATISSENISQSYDELRNIVAQATGRPVNEVAENSALVEDLGLTSIARLELVMAIEQRYRLDLDDSLIVPEMTVAQFRKIIEKRERGKSKNIFWFWTNSKPLRLARKIYRLALSPFFKFFVSVEVKGLENLKDVQEPAIFIANHLSYLDQPVILEALPDPFKNNVATAAWQEFFFDNSKNPIKVVWKRFTFVFAATMQNVFPLPQSSGFKESMAYMGKLIDNKINFLIFPEGSRSTDGQMLPFRPGLGYMVSGLRVPVIPVNISGLEKVFPPGSLFPKPGKVVVTFGWPLYFSSEAPESIVEQCQEAVRQLKHRA